MLRTALSTVVAVALLTGPLAAQSVLHQFVGEQLHDAFGSRSAGAGDVDGDGIGDVLIGAPAKSYAQVRSGADGSLIHQVGSGVVGGSLGTAVAGVGDLDGDGRAEFAVSSAQGALWPNLDTGLLVVYSGLTGTPLQVIEGEQDFDNLGTDFDVLPDVDGDGVPEFVVGVPFSDDYGLGQGKVVVFSGAAPATPLYEVTGPGTQPLFGEAVAVIGDADKDGVADFAVGVHRPGAGYVAVFSGADGSLVTSRQGQFLGDQFGYRVSAIGDLDGDGAADVLVGSWPQAPSPLSQDGVGYVQVVSGADGAVLLEVQNQQDGSGFGQALAGPGDLDGDGVPDLAVGCPWGGFAGFDSGFVRLVSGSDGRVLSTLASVYDYQHFFGIGVEALGDLDGDGVPELGVGTSNANAEPNYLRVFSLDLHWVDVQGGVPGWDGLPMLAGEGSLEPGSPFTVTAGTFPAFAPLAVVLGFSRVDLPFKGGVLVPFPDLVLDGIPASDRGGLRIEGTWPAGVPSGVPFWVQVWGHDGAAPKDLAATNGLEVTQP